MKRKVKISPKDSEKKSLVDKQMKINKEEFDKWLEAAINTSPLKNSEIIEMVKRKKSN